MTLSPASTMHWNSIMMADMPEAVTLIRSLSIGRACRPLR